MGPDCKEVLLLECQDCWEDMSKGIITDAYEMRRVYMDDFNTPSACIAYGANIETSTHPDVVSQYGLTPGQYYFIASRLVPENNADLIVEAFSRMKTSKVLAIAGNANYKSDFVEKLKRTAAPMSSSSPRRQCRPCQGTSLQLLCVCARHMMAHQPALVKALGFGNMVIALNTLFNQEVVQTTVSCSRKMPPTFRRNCSTSKIIRRSLSNTAAVPRSHSRSVHLGHITDQYEELFLQLAAGDDPARTHSTVVNRPEALVHTAKPA